MIEKIALMLLCVLTATFSSSCTTPKKENPLDPAKPVTITVWHYYNGHIKEKFDTIVNTFNETVGMEKGIVVDPQSVGDVQKLAEAVFDSANKTIGAPPMPDIFAAYPDNAYRINQIAPLVTLETYFSEVELKTFYPAFLEEGRFPEDGLLRIVPIAKSSENLFLNSTYWEAFAKKNNLSVADLSTWEALFNTSKLYYEQTGKSFFSIDSNANFFLAGAVQLDSELYLVKDKQVQLNFTPEFAHKVWQYFYVPYINGYYTKTGKFSSDDAKTGNILAYTGSTAGAAYFPREISSGKQSVPIEAKALPYPYFKDGKPIAIQQGAGMCIAKSDEQHEYAASEFLKWFTQPEQNVKFSVSTGYLPAQSESISEAVIIPALDAAEPANPNVHKTMRTTIDMFKTYGFYNNMPFLGSYDMRLLLEKHLWQQIEQDSALLSKRVKSGEMRADVILDLTSEENFNKWYKNFLLLADKIIQP